MTVALPLYRGLTALGSPLIRLYLGRRLAKGKEDPKRFGERLGVTSAARPEGRLVWLHGASVGEAMSLLPLIRRIRDESGWSVLLTTGTVSSARIIQDRLPPGALHQYVPVDSPFWVGRFLDHWRPDLGVWAESEFWPNLMTMAQERDIPLALVNGRVSDRSFRRWGRYPATIGALLSCFALCMAQSEADGERLSVLGAKSVICPGNLKYAAPPLPFDADRLAAMAAMVGDRPRWLAASTFEGEEKIAAAIHMDLKADHPDLLTIIVPRHAQRGDALEREFEALGLKVARASRNDEIPLDADIFLGDVMGEMGLFYRLSPIAFIGRSLAVGGGQNPLEPAKLGVAVLFGPAMDNFREIAATMIGAGAARQVQDQAALASALRLRLSDPALLERERAAALAFSLAQNSILDKIFAALGPWLGKGDARESS